MIKSAVQLWSFLPISLQNYHAISDFLNFIFHAIILDPFKALL